MSLNAHQPPIGEARGFDSVEQSDPSQGNKEGTLPDISKPGSRSMQSKQEGMSHSKSMPGLFFQ